MHKKRPISLPGLAPTFSGQHKTDPNPSMWVVPAAGTQASRRLSPASVTGVHLAVGKGATGQRWDFQI